MDQKAMTWVEEAYAAINTVKGLQAEISELKTKKSRAEEELRAAEGALVAQAQRSRELSEAITEKQKEIVRHNELAEAAHARRVQEQARFETLRTECDEMLALRQRYSELRRDKYNLS